jgi:hypothetical protein
MSVKKSKIFLSSSKCNLLGLPFPNNLNIKSEFSGSLLVQLNELSNWPVDVYDILLANENVAISGIGNGWWHLIPVTSQKN